MSSIGVEASRCPQNHYCPVLRVCHVGAISQISPFSAPVIDENRCTGCGKCIKYCGFSAFYSKN